MIEKFKFYDKHGVEEYYIYDPYEVILTGYVRTEGELRKIEETNGWTSPLLGIRFDLSGSEMVIYGPDGQRFMTYQEIAEERDRLARDRDQIAQDRDRAVQQRDQIAQDRDRAVQQRDQIAQDRDQITQELEAERSETSEWRPSCVRWGSSRRRDAKRAAVLSVTRRNRTSAERMVE